MDTNKRVTAASAAAVLGLFLAGCDNTQETPQEDVTTPPAAEETQLGGTEDTGADGTSPEGDTGSEVGGTGTGAEDMVPETDPDAVPGGGDAGS